jgi:hypothetical protein
MYGNATEATRDAIHASRDSTGKTIDAKHALMAPDIRREFSKGYGYVLSARPASRIVDDSTKAL